MKNEKIEEILKNLFKEVDPNKMEYGDILFPHEGKCYYPKFGCDTLIVDIANTARKQLLDEIMEKLDTVKIGVISTERVKDLIKSKYTK